MPNQVPAALGITDEELLTLAAEGLSNRQIAERLGCSVQNVWARRKQLRTKMIAAEKEQATK